jgi:hypothetical protein
MAKRPREPNQLAKMIVDIATGEAEDTASKSKRHLSKRQSGGMKDGNARAKKLSASERRAIAQKAAAKRWPK